ncbi:MAG: thiamine pyrophosphate-binding protein [Xanthobacteraceae bacterium]
MATVSDIIAKTLVAYDTKYFFCMMGGDHELWFSLADAGLKLINCRSESGAVYMADGYARVTGKPGFVYGQRGPGVSNVAGALADPLWASSPVVSLTSALASTSRDRFEYQDVDGLPLHQGVTRWNKTVSSPDRAGAMLRAAIRIATGTPPGPVHLEIPADMFRAEADDSDAYREQGVGHVNDRRVVPDRAQVARMVELLLQGEKPLIVAGGGVIVSEAWDALTAFADALSIPVATTLGGKGAIDAAHDLAVGVIGRNSSKVGNDAVRDADTVLAIGTRLGGLATHRWTLPFGEKRLIQVDSDPQIIGHNYPNALGVIGDAKLTFEMALAFVDEKKLRRPRTPWAKEIAKRVETWRGHAAKLADEKPNDGIHPADVIARLREVMAPEDLIAADTGAHGGWVGGLFPVKAGRSMVRANGSLGWVFPGAMGAVLASPQRRTVAVSGDGGMLYHIAEFETAMRCDIPIVAVVLNNASLASERHHQERHYKRVITEVCDYRDVDFAAVARAFGAHGTRVEDRADVRDAVRDALASKMPALVDVRVSRNAGAPSANNDKTRLV